MKYYVKHDDGLDGPFRGRAEAEAHVRRCEYVPHNIDYEYVTEAALMKELGLDDTEGIGEEE